MSSLFLWKHENHLRTLTQEFNSGGLPAGYNIISASFSTHAVIIQSYPIKALLFIYNKVCDQNYHNIFNSLHLETGTGNKSSYQKL